MPDGNTTNTPREWANARAFIAELTEGDAAIAAELAGEDKLIRGLLVLLTFRQDVAIQNNDSRVIAALNRLFLQGTISREKLNSMLEI